MKKYKNKAGDSGVSHYEIGDTFIKVKFLDKLEIYTYNYENPGKSAVEKMKVLAKDGEGLSTFIAQEVRDNYFKKI